MLNITQEVLNIAKMIYRNKKFDRLNKIYNYLNKNYPYLTGEEQRFIIDYNGHLPTNINLYTTGYTKQI